MYNCNSTFIEITPFKFEKKEKTRNSWQISKKISDKRNVRFPKLKLTFLKALDNSLTNIVSGNLQDFIWLLRNRFVNFAKSSGLECENTGLSVLFENKLKKICSLMTRKPLLSSFYHIILVYIKLLLASKKTKTFCGVFCERATPGGYLKFLHFFIFLIFQKIVSESNCI